MNIPYANLPCVCRPCGCSLGAIGLAAVLALALPAQAQFQPGGIFGGKASAPASGAAPGPGQKSTPTQPSRAPGIAAQPDQPHRLTEILIELAWLGDPITFPYFLEARTGVGALEVRGYVPNKAVRDKALNIARVHCPLKVVDGLKEHPSLAVKPVQRSPEQLAAAVQTAVKESFPQLQQHLRVECFPGGLVQVTGAVASHEQKLAISQAFRRLHGCTSISNLTQVGGFDNVELAAAAPKKTTDQAKEDKAPRKGFFSWLLRPSTDKKDPRPGQTIGQTNKGLAPGQTVSNPKNTSNPYETRGAVLLPEEPSQIGKQPTTMKVVPHLQPPPNNAPPLGPTTGSVSTLKKRIETALPGREVQVTMLPNNGVRLEVRPRPGEDSSQLAGQIFTLPDLEPFGDRVELHFLLANEK